MAEAEDVQIEQVRRVAELANLKLTAEEEVRMARDLNAILGHIAQLNELDTSKVQAMARVGEVLGKQLVGNGEDLRRDGVVRSIERELVLREAPQADERFFKVPKVIER